MERFDCAAQGEGWVGIRPGFMLVVPPSAGLPCDARAEVVPGNSLRGLRPLRSNSPGKLVNDACYRTPTSTLRVYGTNKALGRMPPQPFFAPLVACHGSFAHATVASKHATIWNLPRLGIWACHQRGDKSRCGTWLGALLASQARREGQVCPLLKARGWRACLSPKGELRSHLTWTVRL